MNQTKNLIQWKNLTDEQKAGFDFENYRYEMQCRSNDWLDMDRPPIDYNVVCRLKIEPDKWYAAYAADGCSIDHEGIIKGSSIDMNQISRIAILRPAKPDEIPKEEITLEDRVKAEYGDFDVVMLEFDRKGLLWMPELNHYHITAQSMKNFSGYIYDFDQGFKTHSQPIWPSTHMQPIAAIFSRGEG